MSPGPRSTLRWSVGPLLGIAAVTIVMGAKAGILVYLAPAEAVLIAGLLLYARRTWRRADDTARSTGFFCANAAGRLPESTMFPPSNPSVGLVNGPAGKLTADATGIRWSPNWPRRSAVPAFDADWSEVQAIEVVAVHRLGDPAFVHISLRSGVRRSVLAASANALRITIDRYAPGLIVETT